MGTDPLRKNRGNDASHKLKGRIFYSSFPQAVTASIRILLMSKYVRNLTFRLSGPTRTSGEVPREKEIEARCQESRHDGTS
jgi:hypothetical protein